MSPDLRPTLWVGHILLSVPDPEISKRFFLDLGLRDAEPGASVGVLELRGGTHLLLLPGDDAAPEAGAPFDLMVDDVDTFHARLEAAGHEPGPIEDDEFHRCFQVREPGGHLLTINSSHVTGLPV